MIKVEVVNDPQPFTPAQEKCARKLAWEQLERTGESGRSASGKTIAYAVEYCETKKIPYILTGFPDGGYHLHIPGFKK